MSAERTQQDFLLVDLGDSRYALPGAAVESAVAPGAVTPLPFVPVFVEGLINVNERIVPLIDLRRLLGLAAADGSELVVVETTRAPCALRVDRIVGRAELADDTLQPLHTGERSDDAGNALPSIVDARFEWEGRAVLVFSLAALGQLIAVRETAEGRRGLLGRLQQDARGTQEQTMACIAVRAAGERYALPLEEAIEILDLPAATAIPGAPDTIEGIAIVRDEALLVLSLPKLLRRGNHRSGSPHVVVIDRGGTRYGLRLDEVDGIVTCDTGALRRVEDENSEVGGVLVLEEQVLGLLEARRLLSAERHVQLLPFVPARRRGEHERERELSAVLEISLGQEQFGIPLDMVRRIAGGALHERVQTESGSLVSGAVNIDGQVVPVVDFATLLQLAGAETAGGTVRECVWVVIGNEVREWAVPVREARRIVDIPVEAIEDVGQTRNGLVSGIATVDNQLLPLLSTRALLEAS